MPYRSLTSPDEVAFRIMKTPSYTAITAREVIHLIKCISRVPDQAVHRISQRITNNIPEPILLSRTEVQNINQNKYPKRLQGTSPNHVQNPRLLVPVDAKISGDNISTTIVPHGST